MLHCICYIRIGIYTRLCYHHTGVPVVPQHHSLSVLDTLGLHINQTNHTEVNRLTLVQVRWALPLDFMQHALVHDSNHVQYVIPVEYEFPVSKHKENYALLKPQKCSEFTWSELRFNNPAPAHYSCCANGTIHIFGNVLTFKEKSPAPHIPVD